MILVGFEIDFHNTEQVLSVTSAPNCNIENLRFGNSKIFEIHNSFYLCMCHTSVLCEMERVPSVTIKCYDRFIDAQSFCTQSSSSG